MTASRVLYVLNTLAAVAAARVRDDREGELLLMDDVDSRDLPLFGQGASAILADIGRHGGSLDDGSPVADVVSPRLLASARLLAAGDRVTAFEMIQRPTVSPSDAVDAVASAWLAVHDGDPAATGAFAQRVCAAYRSALEAA